MKKNLILFLFFSCLPSMVFATSYYVTQTGAGSSTGASLDNAWSVATFNATSKPTGGDTVFFSGVISSTVIPNSSGTGNETGRLVLDFSGATLSGGITIDAKNYLTFLGGAFSSSSNQLINCNARDAHDITISGFTYKGLNGNNGTRLFFRVGLCSNVLISNNTADNLGSFVNAYNGPTSNLIIRNNFARTSTNEVQQTDLITLGDASNVIIEGNKLISQSPGSQVNSRHNDIIQTFRGGGSSSANPANWIIRYNWLELAVPAGTDTDGSNSWTMLEGMTGTNKIYSNVFVGGGGAIATNGLNFNSCLPSVIVYLYNNTFIAHRTPLNTVRFQNSGTLYAKNNVGQADGVNATTLQWDWGKAAVNKNYFFDFGNCNSTFAGLNGSCDIAPNFVSYSENNFALQSTSPLINAGDSTIGSEYSQGITPGSIWPNPTLSSRITGNWGVGAFVYGGSVSPQLPLPNPLLQIVPPKNLRIL